MLATIGMAPDNDVARKFGISSTSVQLKRVQLGIPAVGRLTRWTPDIIALLGTVPDVQIARKLNVAVGTVTHRRNRKGIKSYSLRKRFKWNAKHLVEVRLISVRAFARKYGISKTIVHEKRREHAVAQT